MQIGVFGGTFDPIHLGHLIVAEEAAVRLNLNPVLFVPAGQPWLKEHRAITAVEHRIAMVKLAIANNPKFELSTIEIERPGPSYTIDTMRFLQAKFGSQAKLFFILGWDSLMDLPRWKEPLELIKACTLVAVPRQNYVKSELDSLDRVIPGIVSKVILLDMPIIGISSSEIRKRIAEGGSIRYWVPEAVERYIIEHGLYRLNDKFP